MPAPTTYTEADLRQFMLDELAAVGASLGWTTSSAQVTRAVYAVARLLGVSDVATVTDLAKLEALARWQAWVFASRALASKYDLKAGASSLTRSQVFEQARLNLADARVAAMVYPEARATEPGTTGRRPAVGTLCRTAPVSAPCGAPDGNDPTYVGSVYR